MITTVTSPFSPRESLGESYWFLTVHLKFISHNYQGVITPDDNQAIEACFLKLDQLPEETNPFIKNKLFELKGQLKQYVSQ